MEPSMFEFTHKSVDKECFILTQGEFVYMESYVVRFNGVSQYLSAEVMVNYENGQVIPQDYSLTLLYLTDCCEETVKSRPMVCVSCERPATANGNQILDSGYVIEFGDERSLRTLDHTGELVVPEAAAAGMEAVHGYEWYILERPFMDWLRGLVNAPDFFWFDHGGIAREIESKRLKKFQ